MINKALNVSLYRGSREMFLKLYNGIQKKNLINIEHQLINKISCLKPSFVLFLSTPRCICNRLCPSVHPFVCPSYGQSVRWSVGLSCRQSVSIQLLQMLLGADISDALVFWVFFSFCRIMTSLPVLNELRIQALPFICLILMNLTQSN